MIKAYPISNLHYKLISDRSYETYRFKDLIKKHRGKWENNHWIIPFDIVDLLPVQKMTLAILNPYCHELEETKLWVTEEEIKNNKVSVFCGRCDSRTNTTIKQILEGEYYV